MWVAVARHTGAMSPASPWPIDPGAARDLAEVIGWDPGTGPSSLLGALADHIPAGTTAKLEAVAHGELPPGADPEAVARRILDDRTRGRPTPAWSCWALSTVMAALLAAGEIPCDVVALRRIDGRSPLVDVHSLVLVGGPEPMACDPYFASVLPGPGERDREGLHRGVWARRTDEPAGRWTYEVGRRRWSSPLCYRTLAPVLDRGDVAALCAVSVTHTGVPPGPCASLWRADVATDAFVHRDGGAAVREWRGEGPDAMEGVTQVTEHADWDAAAADLGDRTGIAIL